MNKVDLSGRVAVITGGARGIGFAAAARMLTSGAAAVALWDVDAAALQEAAKALGKLGTVTTDVVDLTEDDAVAGATRAVVARHGKIDILVNNAGITGGNEVLWKLDPKVWRQVIDVNLISQFLCCHFIVPEMLKSGYGRIVNIASVAGKEGNPKASHYSASKAAVIGLTKSLGKELATSNIAVNCITPAAAKTDIFKQMTPEFTAFMLSKIPMGRFVEVEEIAAMIAWLSSEELSFTTGAVFDITGGRSTY